MQHLESYIREFQDKLTCTLSSLDSFFTGEKKKKTTSALSFGLTLVLIKKSFDPHGLPRLREERLNEG